MLSIKPKPACNVTFNEQLLNVINKNKDFIKFVKTLKNVDMDIIADYVIYLSVDLLYECNYSVEALSNKIIILLKQYKNDLQRILNLENK